MSERRGQIEERLDRGIPPTEAEVRWLLKADRDKEQTIRVLTDAAMEFARTVTDLIDRRQRLGQPLLTLGGFDDHAGQYIDQ